MFAGEEGFVAVQVKDFIEQIKTQTILKGPVSGPSRNNDSGFIFLIACLGLGFKVAPYLHSQEQSDGDSSPSLDGFSKPFWADP